MARMNLEGRTALVTGSSKNIGRAIANRLAEAGADVGITARSNREGCEETLEFVESAGSEGTIVLGDLANVEDISTIVDTVRDDLGSIDILVNNAAIRPAKAFEEITMEDWDLVHNVNSRAPFLLAREVVPDMQAAGAGSIINMHGEVIYRGSAKKVHVCASKTSALGLTLSLAARFGPDNIRVNGVVPGRAIETERKMENYDNFEHYVGNITDATPLRRRGTPEEIADICCYLSSEAASFITGQIIQANGGLFPTITLGNVGLNE